MCSRQLRVGKERDREIDRRQSSTARAADERMLDSFHLNTWASAAVTVFQKMGGRPSSERPCNGFGLHGLQQFELLIFLL
mmetsp:Transcript_47643/g.85764  ORF Transcript_47643/g.85764 Transcript_47643/m.85764 type:complete len:80 (+) Transcript_47643:251-490(+)